jgi:hypothetical protein
MAAAAQKKQEYLLEQLIEEEEEQLRNDLTNMVLDDCGSCGISEVYSSVPSNQNLVKKRHNFELKQEEDTL